MIDGIFGKYNITILLLYQLNHVTGNPPTTLEYSGTVNVAVLRMNLPIRKFVHPV